MARKSVDCDQERRKKLNPRDCAMSSSSLNQPGYPGMLRRSNMTQQGSPVMLHRSMSNSGLKNLAHSSSFVRRNNDRDGMGNNAGVSPGGSNAAYRASLVSHYAEDLDRRRRAERAVEEIRTDGRHWISIFHGYVQPFFMAIRMKDRNFDPRRDILRASFTFGKQAVTKWIVVELTANIMTLRPESSSDQGNQSRFAFPHESARIQPGPAKVGHRLHQQEGFNITFQIHIPANALVGLWRVNIETTTTTPGARVDEFRFKDDIYILFDPFCRDDPVYLDNEELRREYLMNETGKVFVGTHHRPKGRRCVYGQFSDVALPAAQLLLEQSDNEGFGLLEGKWEGSFEDGVCPWVWTGSNKIFEHYLRNGSKPVKYGQCWVFAAVATSIFRALGIPSRPVTNFVSARDTNHTLSVNKYFDNIFGDEMKGGLDGCCVLDILDLPRRPPEVSHPCHGRCETLVSTVSLLSLVSRMLHLRFNSMIDREGLKFGCHDLISKPIAMDGRLLIPLPLLISGRRTRELFAEVNAEVSHFQEDETSHWGYRKIHDNNYQVGRMILTKRPGADDDASDADAEDITSLYNNPDGMSRYQKQGDFNYHFIDIARKPWYDESRHPTDSGSSAAERVSAMNASRSVERTQPMFDNRPVNEDVYFDLIEQEKVAWGQPFNLQVLVQRSSVCSSTWRPWDEYRDKIVDYGHIKIFAMASVQETKQSWSEEDDFQLEKPKLDVQIRGNPQVGQDCFATFSFMNPVSVTLTECEFTFEGPGLVRPQTVKYRNVKPGEMISFAQKFIPRFNGERKLIATFNSRELGDIVGSRPIHVRD
ncbi:hypothetical protein DAPPUDRAFT_111732 [Daphnia pulex]|uniref:Transglutaminase-like domain-containing protein n=1 Tax=Daphnia pulex TaxID=6669 RepID=E9HA01_DAPPU|nr:hypothetical protein DAPPUDRAFT_111732 [Daphnia pulex]|eukprot:EFX71341.1 hypothetical protein DAPPUDRAFT_111732 [Daphnia pulex]